MRLVPLPHQIELRRPIGGLIAQLCHQLDEIAPSRGRLGRRRERCQRIAQRAAGHAIEHLAGCGRADAVQHLHDAEAGHPVGRVLGPAQHGQHVLDVCRLDELEAAELDERDVAAGQLDLKHGAVVRGAEQHRLLLERVPSSRLRSTLSTTKFTWPTSSATVTSAGLASATPMRAQVLGEPLARQTDDGVGGGQDRLRRAVVLLQRHDAWQAA